MPREPRLIDQIVKALKPHDGFVATAILAQKTGSTPGSIKVTICQRREELAAAGIAIEGARTHGYRIVPPGQEKARGNW